MVFIIHVFFNIINLDLGYFTQFTVQMPYNQTEKWKIGFSIGMCIGLAYYWLVYNLFLTWPMESQGALTALWSQTLY